MTTGEGIASGVGSTAAVGGFCYCLHLVATHPGVLLEIAMVMIGGLASVLALTMLAVWWADR